MSKYRLKYAYGGQGQRYEEYDAKIIEGEDLDECLYKYHRSNGFFKKDSLEDFKKLEQYVKEWATSIKEIKDE